MGPLSSDAVDAVMRTMRAEFSLGGAVRPADLELWQARLRDAGADTQNLPGLYKQFASTWSAHYHKPCLNDLVRYVKQNREQTDEGWRRRTGPTADHPVALEYIRRIKLKIPGFARGLRVPEADPRESARAYAGNGEDVADDEIPF